ncbi:MAG: hypothetical protein II988_04845 [Clostridia bacterium]|nr:hypothetical protein [Clostridia bacterium]
MNFIKKLLGIKSKTQQILSSNIDNIEKRNKLHRLTEKESINAWYEFCEFYPKDNIGSSDIEIERAIDLHFKFAICFDYSKVSEQEVKEFLAYVLPNIDYSKKGFDSKDKLLEDLYEGFLISKGLMLRETSVNYSYSDIRLLCSPFCSPQYHKLMNIDSKNFLKEITMRKNLYLQYIKY